MFGLSLGKKNEKSLSQNAQNYNYESAMPEQGDALRKMLEAYMGGNGEFGFGPAAQSMNATLGRTMAGRGISPTSGVYDSALGNSLAALASNDANARRMYGLNLATADPNIKLRRQHGYTKGKASGTNIGASASYGG